jgi:tetratricopeptide (TPR) repeat protein
VNYEDDSEEKSANNKFEEKMDWILAPSTKFATISFSFLKIIIIFIMIVSLFFLLHWIWVSENVTYIQPFQVSGMENISGKSLADLLYLNLHAIDDIRTRSFDLANNAQENSNRNIHSHSPGSISALPSLITGIENLDSEISKSGKIAVEGTSFSLGDAMLTAKELAGHRPDRISGSLQKYGLNLIIVAKYENQSTKEVDVWMASRNLSSLDHNMSTKGQNKDEITTEEIIPDMISDLSFQIYNERSKKKNKYDNTHPRTWQAFKNLTKAKEEYLFYNDTKLIDHLEKAMSLENDTRFSEPGYISSDELDLISILGTAYLAENESYVPDNLYINIPNNQRFQGFLDLGSIYLQDGQYEKSLKNFDNAINIGPLSSEAWKYKGIACIYLGQYENSTNAFSRAIELGDHSASVWAYKGWSLFKQGNPDEAFKDFEKSEKRDYWYAPAWNFRGIYFDNKNNYVDALDSYNRAIKLDPKWADPWDNKGWMLYKQAEYKKALDAFDNAISLEPDWATPWNDKGLTFEKMGNSHDALRAYETAISLDSEWVEPLINKGRILLEIGDKEEANSSFERAIMVADEELNNSPNDYLLWYYKGSALSQLNKPLLAYYAYDNSTKLNPNSLEAWTNKTDALEAALEAVNKSLEIDPNNATALNNKAYVLEKLGKHKSASATQ